ncbi:MAG: class I SAM-dependent methyltransferase [Gemmata sp.]
MVRILALAVTAAVAGVALAAEPPKREKPKYEFPEKYDPDGIGKVYLGREIAHVMGYGGIGWLERKERIKEEAPEKLIKALDLKDGMVVADVGAGSGYHTFMMAPLVGAKGKVIASDIQQQMLDVVTKKAKELKVTNVETVRGTALDPKLPSGKVDLALMVDVYHEFEHPYEMTERLVEALRPGGRLVLVEFKAEDDKVLIKRVHKMTERQVLKELAVFPEMEHTKTVGTLPWQHVVIFTKKEPKR